jgi:hypothetical protein
MEVVLSPNPSSSRFILQVKSMKKEPVQVMVLDASGRSIERLKSAPGDRIFFGENLTAGTYLVEVRQGNEVKTVKAIKIR